MQPCSSRIDANCFAANPAWAKQAFAYRLVHLLTPKPLTRRLPRGLRPGLVGPGISLPSGMELPPGVVLPPGTELPPGWQPGDPLPPGAMDAPQAPPGTDTTGTIPPGYTEPWSPGPLGGSFSSGPIVEHGSGTFTPTAGPDDGCWIPAVILTNSWTYLKFGKDGSYRWDTYINFSNVLIPKGAKIVTAYIIFESADTRSTADIHVAIRGFLTANATNPVDAAAADDMPLTSASYSWNPGTWTQYQSYNSPEIGAVVEEIVGQSGWAAGNNLMIVIKSTGDSQNFRAPIAWDAADPRVEPQLYVEW